MVMAGPRWRASWQEDSAFRPTLERVGTEASFVSVMPVPGGKVFAPATDFVDGRSISGDFAPVAAVPQRRLADVTELGAFSAGTADHRLADTHGR